MAVATAIFFPSKGQEKDFLDNKEFKRKVEWRQGNCTAIYNVYYDHARGGFVYFLAQSDFPPLCGH